MRADWPSRTGALGTVVCKRFQTSREKAWSPLAKLGANYDIIADCRIGMSKRDSLPEKPRP